MSVDDQYLLAYRSIAALLLHNLFAVAYSKGADQAPRLDVLILNWNRIEQNIKGRLRDAGIDDHTWKWEVAFQKKVLTPEQVQDLTELRMARNRLVHSATVDAEDVGHWVRKSKRLLDGLETNQRDV